MQAICKECGKSCTAKVVDNGIGTTEAWGIVSTDHLYEAESDCCDSECLDEYGNEISYQDVYEYEEGERDYYGS